MRIGYYQSSIAVLLIIVAAVLTMVLLVTGYDPMPPVISGVVIAFVAMVTYVWQKSMETKLQRYRMAEMLLVELGTIGKVLCRKNAERSAIRRSIAGSNIPAGVYERLVNSGNIASFDVETQYALYKLYESKSLKQWHIMQEQLPEISKTVAKFKQDNKFHLKFF